MKNFLVIVFFLPLFAAAKPEIFKTGSRPHLQFGGQVGANLNYFVYKNGVQRDVSAGYQGGFFFRVTRQKAFVQFELNFLRSTVKLKNGIFSSQFGNNIPFSELKMKYHTVGIPFIFGAYAVKKPIYKLRFYNGIEAEFIAKTKATISQNNNEVYRLKREEKRDIFRPAQFSYQLGMGMDIAMFIFDAKYNVGMRSFFKENYRTQTHLFQFTVGAIF
ncbi:MAG: outer membrane beta-barrel protein [Chitinophagales bacterium]|nr:outer membrane beta-barrel protein [Chitinophagales bacterium]HNY56328.1 outer membrane beta-barrel protein [Chitinophagales bacterium]